MMPTRLPAMSILRSINRGIRNGCGRFDDDLHRLPDSAHGRDNRFFAHGHDVIHVALDDRKVWRADICSQSVGDREFLFRLESIVRARNDCAASSTFSGSAAITLIFGRIDFAAIAVPLSKPPPPTGTSQDRDRKCLRAIPLPPSPALP